MNIKMDRAGVIGIERQHPIKRSHRLTVTRKWVVGKYEKAAVRNWTKRERQGPMRHRVIRIVTNSFFERGGCFGRVVAVDKTETLMEKLLSQFGLC